jgi:hypothetical protein
MEKVGRDVQCRHHLESGLLGDSPDYHLDGGERTCLISYSPRVLLSPSAHCRSWQCSLSQGKYHDR